MVKKILFCLILLLVPLAFGSIIVDYDKSGNEFWSPKSSEELFNFTLDVDSDSSLQYFNITIPNDFSYSSGLQANQANWVCNNNSLIECSTSDPLVNSSLSVWFNTNSENFDNENNVSWIIGFYEGIETLISGIDGKAPQTGELDMVYMGSELEDGGDITEREEISLTIDITDQGIGVDKAWAKVTNSSDVIVQSIYLEGDTSFSGQVVTNSLAKGNYTIKVFTNDSFGNLNDSEEICVFTVNPFPDFGVGTFSWDPINPYSGQNLTVFSNITMANITDEEASLVWKLDGEVECQEMINSTKEVNCTFTGFSGNKNISLEVDPNATITESLEKNNYRSRIFSTDLNITILNVLYEGSSYNSTELALPEYNDTLTLNISVNYWNDQTVLDDLELDDFQVYDKWVSGSGNYENKTNRLSAIDSSMNTYGFYLINYTVPGISSKTLEYGDHEFRIRVNKDNYSGESDGWDYFLDGPKLVITFPGMDYSVNLDGSSSKSFNFDIEITNDGTYNIEEVQVVSIESNKDSTIAESDIEDCKERSETLIKGESLTCEGLTIEVKESGTRVTVVVNGTYNSNLLEYEQISNSIDVYDDSSDDEDNNDDSDEDPDGLLSEGGSGPAPATLSTKTQKYINIVSFPDKVEIEQGKRLTSTIKVKNENEIDYHFIKLEVLGIDSSWVIVTPSNQVEVEPMETKSYTVEFNIPEDAEVKDYEGDLKVSSLEKTEKQVFTLSVLPGQDMKITIDQTIEDYQNQIQELEYNITEMKNNGYNTTEAEKKLQVLKDEFNKLLTFRDGGNYKSAYELLDETEDLIEETASVVSGAVVLPSTNLIASYGASRILPGLFGLLLIAGSYTFWGKHFGIKEKIVRKIKGVKKEPKFDQRKADLEIIAGKVRKEKTKSKTVDTKKESEPKPKTSSRMNELEMIKSLVKGVKS